MKSRKRNRMKGFDYSSNNLYFVTNCVKNNKCCFGNVIPVGTSRDLSVHSQIHHSDFHHSEIHHPNNQNSKINNSDLKYVMQLNQFGLVVEEKINWLVEQYKYVDIHNYIVMPNHFHLILEIDSLKVNTNDVKIKSLSSLIGALKSTASNQIHELGFINFSWHRSFHDHIIKDENAYVKILNYIDLNPQKWFEDKFFNSF